MTSRDGFSLIEMTIVVMIGAMLVGVGSQAYGRIAAERAAGNARDALVQSAYRARSEAVRSGNLVYLRIEPGSDRVVVETSGGELLHRLNIADYGVDLIASTAMAVCYSGRGYALAGCTDEGVVKFVAGTDTASARVTRIGQVRRDG